MSSDFLEKLSLAYETRDLIKHLMKIESLEADCLMLNLEDGVSQEDIYK